MATNLTTNIKVKVLKKGYHRMTSDFGPRKSGFHQGIDFTGNPNVENGYDYILAFDDGVVIGVCNTYAKTGKVGGTANMGNYVIIDHGNGFKTRYMHMTKGTVTVKKGQVVKAGQVIGYMGNTGNSTGRHLHFDISKNGEYIDPKPYLFGQKTFKAKSYTKGTYVVVTNLNVRKGPGTNYDKKYYSQLTINARNQIKKIAGKSVDYLPAGIKLTVSEVKGSWGKIPSGWVSLEYCRKVK